MATTLSLTKEGRNSITVEVYSSYSGGYEVFISLYPTYEEAVHNKIGGVIVFGGRPEGIVFGNLEQSTTYYVYAYHGNLATIMATTLASHDVTISATGRVVKSSENKNVVANYGATAWGGSWKRIDVVGTADISGMARIGKNVSRNITGRARIVLVGATDITGIANIMKSEETSIAGRARIRKGNPKKLPDVWNYNGETEPEVWSEAEKDNTEWADGDTAGATEWL